MDVQLIAQAQFDPPSDVDWVPAPDDRPSQALIEFAGRACYQSWDRPNLATRANGDYVRHIVEVGHESVLEHSLATFYITGVSRSCTHELVRHRHLSYSQLSQRYVDDAYRAPAVEPAAIAAIPAAHEAYLRAIQEAQYSYGMIVDELTKAGLKRKAARSAARSVLANATETRIVVSGNYRAWRDMLRKRLDPSAEIEIRTLAGAIFSQLYHVAPDVFVDLVPRNSLWVNGKYAGEVKDVEVKKT